jgi:hypothetical protein
LRAGALRAQRQLVRTPTDGEANPGEHAVHDDAPSKMLYEPAAHATQALALTPPTLALKVPGLHSWSQMALPGSG